MYRQLNDLVRITLINPNTFAHQDLYFNLYDTNIAKKWRSAFQAVKRGPHWVREKKLNLTSGKKEDIYTTIIKCVYKINEFYDVQLPVFSEISTEMLNVYHDFYADYGVRLQEKLDQDYWKYAFRSVDANSPQAKVWPGIRFNEDMHYAFVKLNDLIHKAEMIYKFEEEVEKGNDPNMLPRFIGVVSWEPRIDADLTDEDLLSMKYFLDYGDLCLGYNTLGKNLQQIILDEDKESLEKGYIFPQTTWSNEIFFNMKASDNNPHYISDLHEKWKKLNPEEQGYQWGDWHKNRMGYICIGKLVDRQLKEFVAGSNVLKDFTGYTEIFDVNIVTREQYYRETDTPDKRIPSWKLPPPQLAPQIVKVDNPKRAIITWIMNDICNYNCRYCPPELHDGKNYNQSYDEIKPFVDKIISDYSKDGRTIHFSISGGEPTMSPFFAEMIREISSGGHIITLTTNLSRTVRYIQENFGYLYAAACSFHPMMEFKKQGEDLYIEKLKAASELCRVSCRVMMDSALWDQTVEFIERLKVETDVAIEPVLIQDQYNSYDKKLCEMNYTPEQLDWFNKNPMIPARYTPEKWQRLLNRYPDADPVVYHMENGELDSSSPQTMINKGQTLWYGYKCNIGKESMFIKQDGNIRKANCHMGGFSWGNVKEWQKIDWVNFRKPVICNYAACSCGADVPISKEQTLR